MHLSEQYSNFPYHLVFKLTKTDQTCFVNNTFQNTWDLNCHYFFFFLSFVILFKIPAKQLDASLQSTITQNSKANLFKGSSYVSLSTFQMKAILLHMHYSIFYDWLQESCCDTHGRILNRSNKRI